MVTSPPWCTENYLEFKVLAPGILALKKLDINSSIRSLKVFFEKHLNRGARRGLFSTELLVRKAPEALHTTGAIADAQEKEILRLITEDSTHLGSRTGRYLTRTKLASPSLEDSLHSARECCEGCWWRSNHVSLRQL